MAVGETSFGSRFSRRLRTKFDHLGKIICLSYRCYSSLSSHIKPTDQQERVFLGNWGKCLLRIQRNFSRIPFHLPIFPLLHSIYLRVLSMYLYLFRQFSFERLSLAKISSKNTEILFWGVKSCPRRTFQKEATDDKVSINHIYLCISMYRDTSVVNKLLYQASHHMDVED